MKLLLVEDDLDLGNGVRIALGDHALEVVWVRRLADALRTLEQQSFEMVLLDLGLPDGDGISLTTTSSGPTHPSTTTAKDHGRKLQGG
jgi:two-component system response regulator QseB